MNFPPLRRRNFQDIVEYVQMGNMLEINNDKFGVIFLHHT